MRSIPLLLPLILLISQIGAEESKDETTVKPEVKYVGPIVFSNEKPPKIVFPTPPSVTSTNQSNHAHSNKPDLEYVPFPYQELPVLIYRSKDNPPIHLVSDSQPNNSSFGSNISDSLSTIDKRLGESVGDQRGGRALKWSNFKLFSDKPSVKKSQKWSPNDQNRFTSMSQTIDTNNNSFPLPAAPHVLYTGHPPIHIFPQPIILKEPEFADMTAASEPYPSLKTPNANNFFDISMTASNKHEVSTSPPSTQFYSYGGTPVGSHDSSKNYGFRVKTRGNKHDTEYSSSNNYDNYEDSYSPQLSDGSADSHSHSDPHKHRPSTHYSNSVSSESNDREYDKEYDRPTDSHPRDKSRDKYSKYASNHWLDWDTDNSWLSSLLGYNRYPVRPRRPVAIGLMNSPTNDHLMFAASQMPNPLEMDSLSLMNPHVRHNGWVTGINPMRPTASAIRPVYTLNQIFGYGNYRRPPVPPPHPNQLYGRFAPAMAPAGSTISPMAMKQYGFVPPYMGLPSMAYPVRIPYSPYMMYGFRRPPIGPSSDLSFAESTRNTTNNAYKKRNNSPEDSHMSGSHIQPTFVMPSAKPIEASAPSRPPIIIYQGLRPPIHVYKKPNSTTGLNDFSLNSMSVFENWQQNHNAIPEERSEELTTSTQTPYYQFMAGAEPLSYETKLRAESNPYMSANSAFSPRHSTGDWIPVKQQVNASKDGQQID